MSVPELRHMVWENLRLVPKVRRVKSPSRLLSPEAMYLGGLCGAGGAGGAAAGGGGGGGSIIGELGNLQLGYTLLLAQEESLGIQLSKCKV